MRVELDGLHKVKKRLANGRVAVYYYAWRGGPRLKSAPDSNEFVSEFLRLNRERKQPQERNLGDLAHAMQLTPDYRKLAAPTQRDHEAMFKVILPEFGDMPIEALMDKGCRKDFLEFLDTIESDKQADRCKTTLSRILSFAEKRGIIQHNPIHGIANRYKGSRIDKVWSDNQIQSFLNVAPKHVAWPFIFAVETGQRKKDILEMKWSNYTGTHFRFISSKTKRNVSVMASPRIKSLVDGLERNAVTIFTNSRGKPWLSGYDASFNKAKKKAGIQDRTFHDLRGTFITRRAAEKSDILDIARVVGLSTDDVRTVIERHYLSEKDHRADAVILNMANRNG